MLWCEHNDGGDGLMGDGLMGDGLMGDGKMGDGMPHLVTGHYQ